MSKIKVFLLMLFVFLIGITNVNAMTLKPTGTPSGKKGEEVTLYINLTRSTSEKEVSAIEGILSYDENVLTLSKVESMLGSNWTEFSVVVNNKTFSYANLAFNSLISDTNKNVLKLVFKVKSSAKAGNTTISVKSSNGTDDEGNGIDITGGSHTLKILSDVNTLSSLTVDGVEFQFNKDVTTYNLETNSESVTIKATKTDELSTMSGDLGTKQLNYGTNTFQITVISESGVKSVYTLNIVRPDGRKNINTLDSLEVSVGTINFNKNTYEYNLDVENDVTSITVKATLSDSSSRFLTGYGSQIVDLKEGINSIFIKVQAENESIKTYTIRVNRKANAVQSKSNNNYLSHLSLSDGVINFDKNVLHYEVVVSYGVEKIKVNVITEDDKATYQIKGPEILIFGKNEFFITVTAEDGSIREYAIIIVRENEKIEFFEKAKLKNLIVSGYDLNFDSDVYDYKLKIEKEDSLGIDCVLENENGVVKIEGNENLENGSVIKILVTSIDDSVLEYKINIMKDESSNLSVNLFVKIIFSLVVIMLLILIKIIKAKKKNVLE